MNFKKMGIKVLLVTILLLYVTNNMEMDRYLRLALGVFGIGSALLLIILNNFKGFDR